MNKIKNIGGIGSILVLTGIIPYIGPILSFAGIIMVIVAVYKVGKLFGKKDIFRNYLIAIIVQFVALVVLLAGAFGGLIAGGLQDLQDPSDVFGFMGIGLIVAWILLVVSAYFIKKSFTEIASATGINAFKTAGTLYFVGNILIIAFGLGAIASLVGAIFQIIAFFSLPTTLSSGKTQVPIAPPGPSPEA